MKNIKRILTVLLTACLLLGTMPFAVGAEAAPLTALEVGGVDLLKVAAEDFPTGVSFDSATNTLTLSNATLKCEAGRSLGIYASGVGSELNVVLVGQSSISECSRGAIGAAGIGTLNISGEGTLDIDHASDFPSVAANALNISSGTVNINCTRIGIITTNRLHISGGKVTINYGYFGITTQADVLISGGELSISGAAGSSIGLGCSVGDIVMTDGVLRAESDEVSVVSNRDAYFMGGTVAIKSRYEAAMRIYGDIYISDAVELDAAGYPALISERGSVVIAGAVYDNAHENASIHGGVVELYSAAVGERPITALTVGGVDLLTAATSDYPAGVSYNSATQTLTLNDAVIASSNGKGIVCDGDLTLELVGENGIDAENLNVGIIAAYLRVVGDGALHIAAYRQAVVAMRGMNVEISESANTYFWGQKAAIVNFIGGVKICGKEYTDFATDLYNGARRGIAVIDGAFDAQDSVIPVSYLEVSGVDLLTAPASEYPEGISYNSTTQTLTLNGASISAIGGIYGGEGICFAGDLTIELRGSSAIVDGPDDRANCGIYNETGRLLITGDGRLEIACELPILCYDKLDIDSDVTIFTYSSVRESVYGSGDITIGGDRYLINQTITSREAIITDGRLSKIVSPIELLEYRVDGGEWQSIERPINGYSANTTVTLTHTLVQDGAVVELRATMTDAEDDAEQYSIALQEHSAVMSNGYASFEYDVAGDGEGNGYANGIVEFRVGAFTPVLDMVTLNFEGTITGEQYVGGGVTPSLAAAETVELDVYGLQLGGAEPTPGDVRYVVLGASIDGVAADIWSVEQGRGVIDSSTLEVGEHTITLSLDPQHYHTTGGISSAGELEYSGSWVSYVAAQGLQEYSFKINVLPSTATPMYGDVNGDGEINAKDVLLLKQWLADWEVSISAAAADCNGDGEINAKDLLRLRQYLADWAVNLTAD